MNLLELDRARSRMQELQPQSADAARARRLYLALREGRRAQRAVRRAERALRRAAQASDAVY